MGGVLVLTLHFIPLRDDIVLPIEAEIRRGSMIHPPPVSAPDHSTYASPILSGVYAKYTTFFRLPYVFVQCITFILHIIINLLW